MIGDLFSNEVRVVFSDIAIVLGVIIAAITVFKFPYKRFMLWMRGKQTKHEMAEVVMFETIPRLVAGHEHINDRLEEIVAELRPNHGTSLRDAVNRLERDLAEQGAMMRGWWSQDAKPMYITDETGQMTWCNRAYQDLTQRSIPELMGLGYLGIVVPAEREGIRAEARQAVIDKRDMVLYFNIQVPDTWGSNEGKDHIVPVEATAVPILENKELTGYIGSLRRMDEH